MARYRKIDVRVWSDARFNRLSPMLPSGRALWFYLLTCPETNIVPGVVAGILEGMAGRLSWSPEAFLKAFAEVFREGLAEADWKAGLVWIPNAIRHNQPQSPNVIRSWADAWDEVPECALKVKAWRHLKAFTEAMGEGFAKAFAEAMPIPCPNQEQEQEQEQDPPVAPQGGQLALTADQPARTALPRRAAQRPDPTAAALLADLNAARQRVIPGARPLRPTPENLRHLADRLAAGATADDCRHVIAVREAEVRSRPDSARWFDAVTPFRPDQFAKALAATLESAAAPPAAAAPHPRGPAPVSVFTQTRRDLL